MLTDRLNDHDLEVIVPAFIRAIEKYDSKSKSISAGAMCQGFAKLGEKIDRVKIRSIVNYLRNMTGTENDPFPTSFICSSGNGYWIEHRPSIIVKEASHLAERENAIRRVKEAAFRKAHLIELKSQMSLF